jgi:hypothetical protein
MRLVSSTGTAKKRPTASASAATTVPAHSLEADLQRLAQRDDAAHDRQLERAAAAGPGDDRVRLDGDLAAGGAGRDGPRGDAAHHHALEHGLAADGGIALDGRKAVRAAHTTYIGSPGRVLQRGG